MVQFSHGSGLSPYHGQSVAVEPTSVEGISSGLWFTLRSQKKTSEMLPPGARNTPISLLAICFMRGLLSAIVPVQRFALSPKRYGEIFVSVSLKSTVIATV